jgi:hypothetical protein
MKSCNAHFAKISFILFLTAYSSAFAQFDSLGLNTTWNRGAILLTDNSRLSGFIQNNERLGLIKFKTALDQTNEQSFQEKRIAKMEYFDSDLSRKRKFYSININDEESGFQDEVLFEIIMECKDFAVLSKKSNVQKAKRDRSTNYGVSFTTVGYEQLEKIFLVGVDGKAELIQVSSAFEKDKGKLLAMPVGPFFDKETFKKFVGPAWKDINSYVKKEKLKLTEKDDLVSALEFYRELQNKI